MSLAAQYRRPLGAVHFDIQHEVELMVREAPMPTSAPFACAAVDDKVYLLGGKSRPVMVDTIERYDPFVETWSSPTRLNTPRYGLSAAVVGKRIITMGGTTYSPWLVGALVEILDTEGL